MHAFLKYIDDKVWLSVKNGFAIRKTHVEQWFKDQLVEPSINNKAVNAILNAILVDEFERIFNVKTAKEV